MAARHDDPIPPQTVESLRLLKRHRVPLVVALNQVPLDVQDPLITRSIHNKILFRSNEPPDPLGHTQLL